MIRPLLLAVVLAAGTTGCNQPTDPVPLPAKVLSGIGDVKVLSSMIVPTGEGATQLSGGQVAYVIAKIEFTNDLGFDTTPVISNFILQDTSGRRFVGQDTGSSALVGISNSTEVLKKDEKRVYTVGFRVADPTTTGTIEYSR